MNHRSILTAMLDLPTFFLALSGWLVWLFKEIFSKILERRLARTGAVGVLSQTSSLRCEQPQATGAPTILDFHRSTADLSLYAYCTNFRIEFEVDIFNETYTPLVLGTFRVQFWGVAGLKESYRNPTTLVPTNSGQWQPARTLSIPAHSACSLKIVVPIGINLASSLMTLEDQMTEVVALLTATASNGKTFAFRICTTSFWGEHLVVWPPSLPYPVYNKVELNQEGHKAGHRPQQPVESRDPARPVK